MGSVYCNICLSVFGKHLKKMLALNTSRNVNIVKHGMSKYFFKYYLLYAPYLFCSSMIKQRGEFFLLSPTDFR